nr:reverse transcriptase domain-containing protein [Tanacetum cinerariifolium]
MGLVPDEINTPGRANGVLSYFQLEYEGVSSGDAKLTQTFIKIEVKEAGEPSKVKERTKREKSKTRGRRPKYQETSSNTKYEEGSESTDEDFNSPYKRPKPTPFTPGITHFKYQRRAKLPRNIRVYEGNKDLEDHLSIFSAAAEQEE